MTPPIPSAPPILPASKEFPVSVSALAAPVASDVPEWLPASKFDGGSYVPASDIEPGDYLFEYFESGSYWLPVLAVVVAGGRARIRYGLLGGVTVSPDAGNTIRVLRKADAVALDARRRGLVSAVAS